MAASQIYSGMQESAMAEGQANVAKYNAQVQENEAKAIEQRTLIESQNQAAEGARRLAKLRSNLMSSGAVATEGSPLALQMEQDKENIKENQMIGYRGVVGMQGAKTQANLDRYQAKIYKQKAKNVKTASYVKAGTSMLSGFEYGGKSDWLSSSGAIKIG